MNDQGECMCEKRVEGFKSLHCDIELLGLPLDMALEKSGKDAVTIEYTRRVRGASDKGTPRVVRVRNGVLTVAFFNDAINEDGI